VAIPPRIPLFPLPNVVLFPQMPLPLHVFEPRYRKMVEDALSSHQVIGMTLLQPGWEPEYRGRPPVYRVGCAGRIEQCEPLDQGRYNILLRGLSRFRIVEEQDGEPYRVAAVEPLPDGVGDAASLESLRKQVLAAISRASDGPPNLVLQTELPHELFVNALSQSLTLSPVERQSLLDCDTVVARYARLLEILDFLFLEQTYGRGSKKVH
jgi:Lon protease-like protein